MSAAASAMHGRSVGAAILTVVAVLALLLSVPLASASSDPITSPNPNSAGAQEAAAATGANQNGEATTLFVDYPIYPYKINSNNPSPYELQNYAQTLVSSFASPNTLISGKLWINRSVSPCSNSADYCSGTYQLDGHTLSTFNQAPQSFYSATSCLKDFYINWTHLNSFESAPTFALTCEYFFTTVQAQSWTAQGSVDSLVTNATFIGSSAFDTTSSAPTVTLSDVAWWVPYPAGNWISADIAVVDLSTGGLLGTDQYAYLSTAFLLEWQAYPVTSDTQTADFSFSLTTASSGGGGGGTGGGTNSTGQNGNTTTSGGANSTFGSGVPPVSEVVLGMENVTPGPTYYQASVSWENFWNYNFSGMFYLTGSWIAAASSVTLYANGVPVPAYQFLVSNTSLVLFSGYLTVASQGTVSFVAHYTPTSSFSFLGTMFVLDGLPVTIWVMLAWGGAATCVVIGFLHWRDGAPKEGSTGGRVLSVLVFTLALITIFTLRG